MGDDYPMKAELERKFMVPKLPKGIKKNPIKVERIYQTYVGIGDGDEIRVRKIVALTGEKQTTYTYAFKKGKGEDRLEEEQFITRALYMSITKALKVKPLVKVRTTTLDGEIWRTVEIDKYRDYKLTVVEVEFESKEEMESFEPPSWFGKEITGSKRVSNKTLWRDVQKKKPTNIKKMLPKDKKVSEPRKTKSHKTKEPNANWDHIRE